jgi:MSHA biogenesis protein MshL
MLRIFAAAAALLVSGLIQEMPVTRLAGVPAGLPVGVSAHQGTPQAASQTPAPPAGPPPAQLPPLPVTRLDPGAAAATLDSPRRLTLSFAEPRPIDEVLRLLTAGTPFSVAIDPDVTGSFRGDLKNLTLREALATLLAPLGLDFTVKGTVIAVTRHRVQTRQFDVNVLNVRRGLQRRTGDGAAAELTSTVPAEDVFESISAGVTALLSDSGRMHIDRRAGLATVTDFPERLERVALYLETLHVRSARQVRLRAQVYEVTLTNAASVDWTLARGELGLPPDVSDAGLAANSSALRKALASQGTVRTLWAPEVTALNNEPALVRVEIPGESSLTLTVVPQVSADGIIQLSVAHTWEEHAGDRRTGLLQSTPIVRISEADTVARVVDGSTMILSGLLRPVEVRKPATGAAALFGAQAKQAGHAELVVLLTPTIVVPGLAAGTKQQTIDREP